MDWSYDAWPSGEPYDWHGASRGPSPYAATDFHVDLGCGRIKKARIGIDRYRAPGVNVVMDLNRLEVHGLAPEVGADATALRSDLLTPGLPFEDSSIKSIITHHCLEHIGDGFIPLVDDIYRVLEPGGLLYAITPLFPSYSAVSDADHRRYFMEGTWDAFCGTPGDAPNQCWLGSFSVPYTKARFEKVHEDVTAPTAPHLQWTREDAREIRVALKAMK